jgi:hypothetical protein
VYLSLLDGEYTIGGKPSLGWLLFTCAVTWLTEGRWNRAELEQ